MGLGIGDFDLDGNLDILKTHFATTPRRSIAATARATSDDVTFRAGLGVETRYVSWGAGIVDLDNDGLPDLFYVTGMVYPGGRRSSPDVPLRRRACCFAIWAAASLRSWWTRPAPAIQEAHSSRGVAFGDFDNDGDIDILIMNMNEPPSLLRNDMSGGNHWLKVLLTGPNRTAAPSARE